MRQLVRSLGLAEAIDRRVGVLKRHLPYHESDHVLNLAYNILSGGECLQDVEGWRRDRAYLDALGARKLPAASTAGDFLRRFGAGDALALQEAANEARLKAWALQPGEFFERATLDVDGTAAPTAGECKEGIGLNHEGVWGYGPLVVSLAETGEALYTVNRPANRPSHEGFAEWIDRAVGLAREAGFGKTRVRGDTDFSLIKGPKRDRSFPYHPFFNLHNVATNYPGYFEGRTRLVIPWLSFRSMGRVLR